MAHVLFSYAHSDAERMYPIHAQLELATEHNLWIDRIGLERGAAWENSIKAAIDNSYGVIFAVTETFLTRPFILDKEIPWAFERFKDKQGAQLFPILFDDVDLPDLLTTPYITHVVDARDGDLTRVAAELKEVLPLPVAGRQPFVVTWPRLKNFKGRDAQLLELHQKLVGEGRVGVKTAGLYGTGGIGKTQLAVEYAHRYRYYYPAGVYWLNAAADWCTEIGKCAVHLDSELYGQPAEKQVLAFRQYLATQSEDALIVLDNVANPADVSRSEIAPKLTLTDLCAQTRARLLLTTRVQNLPAGFESVAVNVLAPLDARAVLMDVWASGLRLDEMNISALDALAQALGYLPLALGWMAAALTQLPDVSPADLLMQLKVRGLDEIIRELQANQIHLGTPDYHDKLVSTVLDWQIEQLNGDAPRKLVALTAAFGEAAVVPLERLRLLAGLPETTLVKPFLRAVRELQAFSLVESLADATAFRLHPLTQQHVAHCLAALAQLTASVPQLTKAYREPATLDYEVRSRGIGAVLDDLMATRWVLGDKHSELDALIRLLTLEEPHFVRLSESAHASFTIQQIRDCAHHEGDEALKSACDTWLRDKSHFRHTGLRYPESKAVLRTLGGHSHGVRGALELQDSRLLSWSEDGTLRLWAADGTPGRVLRGHASHVRGALKLRDGRLLSWSGDGTLRLWAADGTPGRVLRGYARHVWQMLELHDGRLLSWSNDATLRLRTADGTPGPVLRGHASHVRGALELRDGRLLSWSEDGTLRLWAADGTPSKLLRGHASRVHGALELRDGRLLSWSNDAILRLWAADGTLSKLLRGHAGPVHGALELGDGRLLSWSDDATLRLWAADGTPGPVLKGHTSLAQGALELGDGRLLSWSNDGTLRLWAADGTPGRVRRGHAGPVHGVLELRDGRLLSWSSDGTLRLWAADGTPGPVLRGHAGPVHGALELRDGRLLSWSSDGTLRLWAADDTPGRVRRGHIGPVWGVRELRDGRLLSWSNDATLRLWESDGTPGRVRRGHAGPLRGALELRDGRLLSWSNDATLRLWAADGTPGPELTGHASLVQGALELRDGRLLSWSGDATLRLWAVDGTPHRVLRGHAGPVHGALELRDGRLVSWSGDATLRLWAVDGTPGRVLRTYARRVSGMLELRDGRLLSWSDDATLQLWAAVRTPGRVLRGHAGPVHGALELQDRRLLSWSGDATLRLWTADGTPGPVLRGHAGPVHGALELQDGRLLSWSDDATLRLWAANETGYLLESVFAGDAPLLVCVSLSEERVFAVGDTAGRVLFLTWSDGT